MKDINTDILIIGAGPAGLSAGIYAARAGKKTLILKGKSRSHLEMAHMIENYPGVEPVSGTELLARMEKHAVHFEAEIISGDAISMSLGSEPKMVSTRHEFITAQTVILAMGKGEHKKSIKNEEIYLGNGLSYCAVCDGAFYRGKKVVVYGSDHEAVEDAQMLQQLGCITTLILFCGATHCSDSLIDKAKKRGVTIIPDTEIIEVKGIGTVQSIVIKNANGVRDLATDGLFIIQAVPSLPLLKTSGVNLTNKDCIAVDRQMQTSIPGVFAAGDITCGGLQIAVAAGEGVTAALSALKYLRNVNH